VRPAPDTPPAAAAPPAAAPPPALPEDAAAAWRAGTEAFGGLAVDLALAATGVVWRDGLLEVTMPAEAATAAAYLRRPEVAAGIGRALTERAGRPLKFTIVVTAAAARSAGSPPPRATPAVSQTTLLREAAEHPLIAHARTLFDAAIRKVEPPRPREQPQVAAPALAAAPAGGDSDTDDADPAGAEHE
jgi:hypothetical protein